jgi:endonuclease III
VTLLKKKLKELTKKYGGLYSSALGIKLKGARESEVFKWFLASMLYGARIGEDKAFSTYKEFARTRVLTPDAILRTGWDGLVKILDNGGYVRYDFSTATDLLKCMKTLKEKYGGKLTRLCAQSKNHDDLVARLMELRGVGPVTASIFLRELRGEREWRKARPMPTQLVLLAARELGIKKVKKTLEELPAAESIKLETALVRVGKLARRGKKIG